MPLLQQPHLQRIAHLRFGCLCQPERRWDEFGRWWDEFGRWWDEFSRWWDDLDHRHINLVVYILDSNPAGRFNVSHDIICRGQR